MNESRLRKILADAISDANVHISPGDITDETSTDTVPTWDSHSVMTLTMAWESESDYQLSDDEISTLTSWPAVMAVLRAHESGSLPVFYKALVLDADGTLWKGIIGEGGITMTPEFIAAQKTYLALKERGVILAIASTNEQNELE